MTIDLRLPCIIFHKTVRVLHTTLRCTIDGGWNWPGRIFSFLSCRKFVTPIRNANIISAVAGRRGEINGDLCSTRPNATIVDCVPIYIHMYIFVFCDWDLFRVIFRLFSENVFGRQRVDEYVFGTIFSLFTTSRASNRPHFSVFNRTITYAFTSARNWNYGPNE